MSVAMLYSTWRTYHVRIIERQRQLRERVAYMLWVMANSVPDSE